MLLAAGCFLMTGCGGDAPKQTKNEIHVVTHANWNPFEYMENGKIVGFDVDLAREAVKRAGLTMDLTDAGWEALFEQIRSHQTRPISFRCRISSPGRRSWCGKGWISTVRRI